MGSISAFATSQEVEIAKGVPSHDAFGIKSHPLGVKPSGNSLGANDNLRDSVGVFNVLPDETLLLLFEYFDRSSLLALGHTCRAFYALTSSEELWKSLFITQAPSSFSWLGSWRSTLISSLHTGPLPVNCSNLFSDALYRPYVCSQINLRPYKEGLPPQNLISRLSDLSSSEFLGKWTDIPFILTGVVSQWPAYRSWSEAALLAKYGNVIFRAEAVDWPLHTYIDYMNLNSDESPLYLFDRDFVKKMDLEVGHNGDYWPPDCFGEDLFALLGDQRPDSRWLIIGPKRSGSTFHKDPNATSAWNAVIKGSKYWIMFPPSQLPPGVYMSKDQSEVTSPLSIAEWLLSFHEEARATAGCVEGVCYEGEVLHVPSGWWHLVVNLEPAVAITQNFIPKAHLSSALRFLKEKADQVSGFSKQVHDPYKLFHDQLRAQHPELLEELEASSNRKRKWESLIEHDSGINDSDGNGFSFGFGLDEEDLEDDS